MEESINSSVITQNDESQHGGKKKTKHAKLSEKKEHFLPHDTYIYGYCLSVCEAGRRGRENSKR